MNRRFTVVLVVIAALACFAVVVIPESENYVHVRTELKWLVRAHAYKAKALAEPVPPDGGLKHIEWDGWGWAGQGTMIYVVFDPTDSLSAAARSRQPGKFSGLPCEVFRVRRLQSDWYTVQFYTNEFWGRTNELNCGGS